MKIGILTHHYVSNPGAVLQAYAQAKLLSKAFNEKVEIIDIRFYEVKNKKYKKFINNLLPLSSKSLISTNYKECLKFIADYDIVIIGSDEVWKIEHGWRSKPFPNIHWLNPDLKCRKIALAASANRLNYKKVGPMQFKQMKTLLESFDFIGARDQHTMRFLGTMGIDSVKICDPTIAYDFTEPTINFTKTGLIAGLNIAANTIKKINIDLSKYKLISYHKPFKKADQRLRLNPFEWAAFYKYMDICITSSYHSVIFALKAGVPVIVRDTQKKEESKLYDLLKDLDMLYCYNGTLEEVLEKYDPAKAKIGMDKMKANYDKLIEEIVKGGKPC